MTKGQGDLRYDAWSTEGAPVLDEEVERQEPRLRARALGTYLGLTSTGRWNAITDVPGVRVGHRTVEVGAAGPLRIGQGPARTGVTVIMPTTPSTSEDNIFLQRVPAATSVLNGAGELIGMTQINEWGLLESPIALTNTLAIGVVHQAIVAHQRREVPAIGQAHDTVIPVVGECDDSWLSDIGGGHVTAQHVDDAIQAALSPAGAMAVAEGCVGSGTGMITCDFAGGIGTSSRKLDAEDGSYHVGVLVQSNFGRGSDLRMGGVPVGALLESSFRQIPKRGGDYGSIIVVVATDAPLDARQLQRVCKRAALGIARTGSVAGHGSGEIIVGFSTGQRFPRTGHGRTSQRTHLSEDFLDPIFRAAIDATEEAILNAICMGHDMLGVNHHAVPGLPVAQVREILARYTPSSLLRAMG
jgi:D-aminopeptidase